jgi:hypothetical protein
LEHISIRDLIATDQIITHAQVTDIFLLGLAVHNGDKLATLDQHFPVTAIQGGVKARELVIP